MDIHITGESEKIDKRIHLVISGLLPNEECTIKLNVYYSWTDYEMESTARFKSNDEGCINLDTDIPICGSYTEANAMGLFALLKDLQIIASKRAKRDFTKEYIICKFSAVTKQSSAEVEIKRRFIYNNIEQLHMYEPFRGEYFVHKDQKSKEQILLLGGSEGSINPILPIAAVLSNYGFDVLALQYFSPPSDTLPVSYLPKFLMNIKLEYVFQAIEWLKRENGVSEISIMGLSKGAELAMLIASKLSFVKKVVAIAPSLYVYSGIPFPISSWSLNGKRLPCIHLNPFAATFDTYKNMLFSIVKLPKGYWLTYELSQRFCLNRSKKRIPVENIKGDICLIGGKKDSMWNSCGSIEKISEIFDSLNLSNKMKSYQYDQCGHAFYVPFVFEPVVETGGNKLEMLKANEDSWGKIIAFLKESK